MVIDESFCVSCCISQFIAEPNFLNFESERLKIRYRTVFFVSDMASSSSASPAYSTELAGLDDEGRSCVEYRKIEKPLDLIKLLFNWALQCHDMFASLRTGVQAMALMRLTMPEVYAEKVRFCMTEKATQRQSGYVSKIALTMTNDFQLSSFIIVCQVLGTSLVGGSRHSEPKWTGEKLQLFLVVLQLCLHQIARSDESSVVKFARQGQPGDGIANCRQLLDVSDRFEQWWSWKKRC